MNSDYIIVLFKNKKRYKIIKQYKTYKNALLLFNSLLSDSNDVIFDVKTENGKDVNYEIALLEKSSDKLIPIFMTDEMGRNIKINIDNPDYTITKIENYKIPEKIQNIKTKEKIGVDKLIKSYLSGPSLKLVSKLNNKVVLQDDDVFNIFVTKSIFDADRLLNNLESYMINNNKRNCLIVKDSSSEQKKYLYEVLSNQGYDKKMLYRTSTTHLKDI